MKIIGFLLISIIFSTFSPAFTQEEPEYVLVEREKLEALRDWIIEAQRYMNELLAENVKLQSENQVLKTQLDKEKTGLFLGANVGYPWGGDALIMYKLNKSGIYSTVGYHGNFHIDIGYMRRVK